MTSKRYDATEEARMQRTDRAIARRTNPAAELARELAAAQKTLAQVREWRLWAHEAYDIPLRGTVTSNRLADILGIPKDPVSDEQRAYAAQMNAILVPGKLPDSHRCTAAVYWPDESEPTECGMRRGHRGDHETYPAGRGWPRK